LCVARGALSATKKPACSCGQQPRCLSACLPACLRACVPGRWGGARGAVRGVRLLWGRFGCARSWESACGCLHASLRERERQRAPHAKVCPVMASPLNAWPAHVSAWVARRFPPPPAPPPPSPSTCTSPPSRALSRPLTHSLSPSPHSLSPPVLPAPCSDQEDYEVIRKIGRGKYSEVCAMGRHTDGWTESGGAGGNVLRPVAVRSALSRADPSTLRTPHPPMPRLRCASLELPRTGTGTHTHTHPHTPPPLSPRRYLTA
jgi:hypothetical protein